MPSTMSTSVSSDLFSSTVMTPSLPTFCIAWAIILPMAVSPLAEMVPTWATSEEAATGLALPGTAAIEQRVLAQVKPGSIILSHDGGGPRGETLAAYPAIMAALRGRGFHIVTIPELLGFRPVYVPCIRLCEGIGLPRRALPRDALIQRAPRAHAGSAGDDRESPSGRTPARPSGAHPAAAWPRSRWA